jgi:hypothetical protein
VRGTINHFVMIEITLYCKLLQATFSFNLWWIELHVKDMFDYFTTEKLNS